jgi:xylulokinase
VTDRYVVAFDVGTSGVKAVLTDAAGKVVASQNRPYRLVTQAAGWVDQDMDEILAAIGEATRQLISRSGVAPASIEGIGVTGQMFNLVAVDRGGKPLAPMISWLDLRATPQARALASRLPPAEQFRQLGSLVTAKDVIPKMLWLREQRPDIWHRTAKLLDCKEAVVMHLTGVPITDYAGASAMRLFDAASRGWNESACALLEIPLSMLPEIALATSIAGGLLPEPAKRLGLPAGTPVVVGAGDVPATQVGAGATAPGDAHLSLGTAGYWGITLAEPLVDPMQRMGLLAHMDPVQWILWLEIATAGGALAWFLRVLGPAAPDHTTVERLVRGSTDDVPVFAPWLSGERAPVFDDHARAAFVGLDLRHGLGHILRAIMEGVAFQVHWAFDYALAFGSPVVEIRTVGGGTMSDVWLQIISDILDRPLMAIRDPQDAGARGAAVCALVGVGLQSDFAFAKPSAAVEKSYQPTPETRDRYQGGYARFKQLYERLQPASASATPWGMVGASESSADPGRSTTGIASMLDSNEARDALDAPPARLAIGADDAGLPLKKVIAAYLDERGIAYRDVGVHNADPVDYPDVARVVAEGVRDRRYDRGILICGTGIGMAIAANKVRGVRAAQAHDVYSAERARKSNDAQVLTMGARVIGPELAKLIVRTWLESEFVGGASARKVAKIDALDSER